MNIDIEVYGIKWDGAKHLPKTMELNIVIEDEDDLRLYKEDIKIFNEEVLELFIENELTNQSGFCHYGWKSYKVKNIQIP